MVNVFQYQPFPRYSTILVNTFELYTVQHIIIHAHFVVVEALSILKRHDSSTEVVSSHVNSVLTVLLAVSDLKKTTSILLQDASTWRDTVLKSVSVV